MHDPDQESKKLEFFVANVAESYKDPPILG
jgi:hypothetical protein